MNKRQLIEIIANNTEQSKRDVSKTIESLINTIQDEILKKEEIYIKGLVTFYPVLQTTRPVRNPKTGESLMFVPRNNVRFKTGKNLLRKLNQS